MELSDSVYNKLKWIALIVLPAIATLYITLAQIWGWDYSEQIALTITAIDTFIGVVLGISSKKYTPTTDGTVTLKTDDGGTVFDNIEFNDTPDQMTDKDTITLDVKAKHLKTN